MDLYLLLEFEHSGSITIKVVFILTMFTVATIDFSYSTIYVKLRQHELKCPNNIITCLKLELVRVLSLTRLRELVIEVSRGVVPDISRIRTHSLRSGRPIAAANASIPVRLF